MVVLIGGNGVPNSLGGIPTTGGDYQYSLTVTDAAGQTATGTFTQHVSTIAVTPGKLPPGIVGTPYSATLVPSGGTGSYSIQAYPFADVPAGLTLAPSGALTGTPTNAGDYMMFVVVFDGADYVAQQHRITIDNAAGEAPAVSLAPDSLVVNYRQGAPGRATIPFAVNSTSTAQPFTALATGIPGASVTPSGGTATGMVNVNLDAAPLATGTYVGALGIGAPASANANDFAPIVLNVAPFGSDTTPPTIGPVSDITAEATSASGAFVTFATPSITDNFYPLPTFIVTPPSGSLFPIGATIVT